MHVQDARFLTTRMNDPEKLIEKPGCLDCQLPVVLMYIEHAALHPCILRRVGFVHRRPNAAEVEDSRKGSGRRVLHRRS